MGDTFMGEEAIQLPEVPADLQPTEEPVVAAVEEPTEEAPADEAAVKKGESSRIKELNQRAKAAEAEVKSLSERMAELTRPAAVPPTPTYTPQVQPGQELTIEQYQTDVAKTAEAKLEMRLAQERAINRIDRESVAIVQQYPQLDPKSAEFDRELSDTITESVEAHVRIDPYSASVTKIVDKLMRPYQRAIDKEVGKQTETVARQVADSALRPTALRQPEKPASEKTIAELERELGTVVS